MKWGRQSQCATIFGFSFNHAQTNHHLWAGLITFTLWTTNVMYKITDQHTNDATMTDNFLLTLWVLMVPQQQPWLSLHGKHAWTIHMISLTPCDLDLSTRSLNCASFESWHNYKFGHSTWRKPMFCQKNCAFFMFTDLPWRLTLTTSQPNHYS